MTNIAAEAITLSPELYMQLALGMDHPLDIIGRFGISEATFLMLQGEEWFTSKVLSLREEIKASGMTIKLKARYMTEVVMEDVFNTSRGADVALSSKLAVLEWLGKAGDVMPKPNAPADGGGGRPSVNIIINGTPQIASAGPETHVIDAKPVTGKVSMTFSPQKPLNADLGAGEEYDDG